MNSAPYAFGEITPIVGWISSAAMALRAAANPHVNSDTRAKSDPEEADGVGILRCGDDAETEVGVAKERGQRDADHQHDDQREDLRRCHDHVEHAHARAGNGRVEQPGQRPEELELERDQQRQQAIVPTATVMRGDDRNGHTATRSNAMPIATGAQDRRAGADHVRHVAVDDDARAQRTT